MVNVMIDWNRVAELRDEIGPDDFGEVVELFLEEVDEVVARLEGGVAKDQFEPELHFIKGSALNLGFSQLSTLCADGEKRAAQGTFQPDEVGNVVSAYKGSRAEFLKELSERFCEA